MVQSENQKIGRYFSQDYFCRSHTYPNKVERKLPIWTLFSIKWTSLLFHSLISILVSFVYVYSFSFWKGLRYFWPGTKPQFSLRVSKKQISLGLNYLFTYKKKIIISPHVLFPRRLLIISHCSTLPFEMLK